MNIRYLLFVLFFLPFTTTFGQSWQWGKGEVDTTSIETWCAAADKWGNSYGGGYQVSGHTVSFGSVTIPYPYSSLSLQSVWVKFDSAGNVLWADGTQAGSGELIDMATDTSGNLIVFGSFVDSVKIDGTTLHLAGTDAQYFLAKFNPSGGLTWMVRDGNVVPGLAFGTAGRVRTDAAGNIYIASTFNIPSMTIGTYTLTNTSSGHSDPFVAKYSPSGTAIWASSIGGTLDDVAMALAVTSTGNVYIAGGFKSASMTVGSSVLTGYPSIVPGTAYIAKFSPSGTPLWGQAAGVHTGWSRSTGLAADASGNVYMSGMYTDTSVVWGGTTITKTYPGSFQSAMYVVRYTPADVMDRHKAMGSNGYNLTSYSMCSSPCGWIWISGACAADVNIDGHILPFILGNDRSFIAGFDETGTAVASSNLPSGGDDANGIACDAHGNVFLCGDYLYNPFVIGPDTFAPVGTTEPFFIGKYKPAVTCYSTVPTATPAEEFGFSVEILPVPTGDELTIRCVPSLPAGSFALIYDITGRLLLSTSLMGGETHIRVGDISPGMYHCRIILPGGQVFTKKVVIVR